MTCLICKGPTRKPQEQACSACVDKGNFAPHKGPQSRFLACNAYEVCFGGAAGGSKTTAMVVAPLRWVEHKTFRALILRRTFGEIEGTLLVESRKWYPNLGGIFNENKMQWQFPSGAVIRFGYCREDRDVYQYQGQEYQYVAWDELTQFTEQQYKYLSSRLRSAKGLPIRMRASTNPGGRGHDWVFKRWGPWLDPESKVKAAPGEILWFRMGESEEELCEPTAPGAMSRTFIPATVADNPSLDADTNYLARLSGLDPVERARLRDGNWLVKHARGEMFQRSWFKFATELPKGLRAVRYWDRAATEVDEEKKNNPDWTVGVRMWTDGAGRYWIDDVVRFRGEPATVENTIKATALADGVGCAVYLEQDPAQAGKFEVASYVKLLRGFNVRTRKPDRDKVTRASPFSAQVNHGNVTIVVPPGGARWLGPFLDELEAFPSKGVKDDQVDAAGGAFAVLHEPTGPKRGTVWEGHRGV